MKKIFLDKRKLVAIILTILFTVSTYFFVDPDIHPYRLKLTFINSIDSANNKLFKVHYSDLNGDGKLERIIQNFNYKYNFSFIVAETFKKEIINQFNFRGKFPDAYKIFIYDINNNNTLDLLIFSVKNDSLFLNAIDAFEEKFLFSDIFITSKPDSVEKDFWDLYLENGIFLDVNDDGKDDFIFSIVAGYARYPRAIYAFDLQNKKIVKKIEFGLYVDDLIVNDLNNDGNPEILVSNSARDNYKDYLFYHDKNAWHFILDTDFNIVSPKDSFGAFTSALHYGLDDKNTYAFFTWGNRCSDCNDKIYIVQSDFTLSPLKECKLSFRPNPIFYNNEQRWFISNYQNKFILIMDKNFNVIKQHNFDIGINVTQKVIKDINDDGGDDIVLFFGNNIQIIDQNLKILAEFKLDNEADMFDPNLFQFEKVDNKKLIFARTQFYQYEYEFVENPLHTYFAYILIGGSVLFYLLIFLLIKFIIFFLIYLNFFIHSFRKSNLGLLLLDSYGKIMFANPKFGEFFELDEKLLKKKDVLNVFADKYEIKDCIADSLKKSTQQSQNFYYSNQNFQINGRVSVTPYSLLFKKIVIGFLVEIENYTEAILQDRIKVWAKYVQKIAHDIKTPLSSVLLGIENVKNRISKDKKLSKDLEDDFERILKQTKRIMGSTKSILQLSNLELINFQVVYIDKVIEDSLEKFYSKLKSAEIEIIKELNVDGAPVWADPAQLTQVFQVLIENSIDAINKNGWIKIFSSISADKNFVIASVSDNGCGIKKEIQNKIFSPYITTKYDGTGIGLYLAKMTIEAHNGKIYFESKENFGSTFTIELPCLQKNEVLKNE